MGPSTSGSDCSRKPLDYQACVNLTKTLNFVTGQWTTFLGCTSIVICQVAYVIYTDPVFLFLVPFLGHTPPQSCPATKVVTSTTTTTLNTTGMKKLSCMDSCKEDHDHIAKSSPDTAKKDTKTCRNTCNKQTSKCGDACRAVVSEPPLLQTCIVACANAPLGEGQLPAQFADMTTIQPNSTALPTLAPTGGPLAALAAALESAQGLAEEKQAALDALKASGNATNATLNAAREELSAALQAVALAKGEYQKAEAAAGNPPTTVAATSENGGGGSLTGILVVMVLLCALLFVVLIYMRKRKARRLRDQALAGEGGKEMKATSVNPTYAHPATPYDEVEGEVKGNPMSDRRSSFYEDELDKTLPALLAQFIDAGRDEWQKHNPGLNSEDSPEWLQYEMELKMVFKEQFGEVQAKRKSFHEDDEDFEGFEDSDEEDNEDQGVDKLQEAIDLALENAENNARESEEKFFENHEEGTGKKAAPKPVEEPPMTCWFHGPITKVQAHELLLADSGQDINGKFLLREKVDNPLITILSCIYRKRPTHHLVQIDVDKHLWKVNRAHCPEDVIKMKDVVDYLRETHPWWPVALTDGVRMPLPPEPEPEPEPAKPLSKKEKRKSKSSAEDSSKGGGLPSKDYGDSSSEESSDESEEDFSDDASDTDSDRKNNTVVEVDMMKGLSLPGGSKDEDDDGYLEMKPDANAENSDDDSDEEQGGYIAVGPEDEAAKKTTTASKGVNLDDLVDPEDLPTDDEGDEYLKVGAEKEVVAEAKNPVVVDYEVNPTPWLHYGVPREDAGKKIFRSGSRTGTFLIRGFSSNPDKFWIVVQFKNKATHHIVERNGNGFLGVNKKEMGPYASIGTLIANLDKPQKNWPVALDDPVYVDGFDPAHLTPMTCGECQAKSSHGYIDDVDGTFYCKPCWLEYFPETGNVPAASKPAPKMAEVTNATVRPTLDSAPVATTSAALAPFPIGARVSVKGYDCDGTIKFVGPHHDGKGDRASTHQITPALSPCLSQCSPVHPGQHESQY